MEQIKTDRKGKIFTQPITPEIKISDTQKKKLIKEFLNIDIQFYKDFENLFLSTANDYVSGYELTEEIKMILINVFRQIKGEYFYKVDPCTGKYIEASDADRQKGIYIAGPTGTGKTTLCKILFKTLSSIALKFYYPDKIYQYNTICVSELSINKEYMKTGDFQFMQRSSLFVDDIGQAKEIQYMGNKLEPLKEIITERYDNLKYTFTSFTSNYPINHNAIISQYGERVADRIQAMANYYTITAKNFRRE